MHLIEYTILTGFLFVIFGGLFLSGNLSVKSKFVSFPRSRLLSYILMTIGTCWFLLGHVMQLGEADFGDYKHIITMLSICILVSAFFFTKDFLAVRALSIITLLYSREVLDSAFLQEPSARLLLVSVVYVMILVALYLGAYPYRMRDFFSFIYGRGRRNKYLGGCFMLCGLSLLLSVLAY
jgi:hypothetical protein